MKEHENGKLDEFHFLQQNLSKYVKQNKRGAGEQMKSSASEK